MHLVHLFNLLNNDLLHLLVSGHEGACNRNVSKYVAERRCAEGGGGVSGTYQ